MLDSMKKQGSKLDSKDTSLQPKPRHTITPSPIGFAEAPTILRQKPYAQTNKKPDERSNNIGDNNGGFFITQMRKEEM